MKRALIVALVDDDAAGRSALAEAIALHGHVAHVAADGPAAVELILRLRPDVSFIDVRLPGFDGYEVARRIRADAGGAGARLIALTGFDRPEDRARALAAGFDRLVAKPVDVSTLVRLIEA